MAFVAERKHCSPLHQLNPVQLPAAVMCALGEHEGGIKNSSAVDLLDGDTLCRHLDDVGAVDAMVGPCLELEQLERIVWPCVSSVDLCNESRLGRAKELLGVQQALVSERCEIPLSSRFPPGRRDAPVGTPQQERRAGQQNEEPR